ncbi:MAG: hypothetical protein IIB99_12765 [Planctomycetes bacterium]|nr:hypothetical protein [Planctomycetota bacterium]
MKIIAVFLTGLPASAAWMLDNHGDFFRPIFTSLVPAALGALAGRRPLVQAAEQPVLLGAVQV